MRTLNVRRAVILLVVVIVVAGSAHLLHSYQLQRNSNSFKSQAVAAWKDWSDGKNDPSRELDALRLMKNYLLLEPQDIDARQQLGFWYAESGRFTPASATLEEVLRVLDTNDPPDPARMQDVRKKLVVVYMGQGRCPDAVSHLMILNKELPNDAELWNQLGKCQITLKQEEEAVKSFSMAIKLRPDRVEIYGNKARALRFSAPPNLPEAQKCMAEMIAYPVNAQSAAAHCVYGLWLAELGKYEQALKQAEATLALQKDHPAALHPAGQAERGAGEIAKQAHDEVGPAALHLAGQAEMELRKFAEAERYARRGIQAAPQQFAMYFLMADIMVHNNQREKAIAVLKEGVQTCQAKDAKAEILWHLANMYLDNSRSQGSQEIAAAVDCMKRLREYGFSPVQVSLLDARLLYADEDWGAALKGFENVRPKLIGLNEAPQLMKCLYYWIGDCYRQQGNPDQATAAFRRSLSFDKSYFKAHDGIARIFLADGRLRDAAQEYQEAVAGSPDNAEAWQAFARTLLLLNLRNPADQHWAQVAAVLRRAEKLNPHDSQTKLLIAEMLLASGQAKDAGDMLQALRIDSPQSVEFWTAQANLAIRQGKMDKAKQILADAQNRLGDCAGLRLAQASLLLHDLGLQAGAEIQGLADAATAFSPAEKSLLWNGLMDYLIEIKEYDRAKELCRQIARELPHDAVIRYRLFELALLTHDARDPAASLAELDRVLAEIDAIAGRGPLWMYGKAVRLKLEADSAAGKPELLDAAMDYAAQAQRMRLGWSRPDVLQGEICRQRGRDEEALQHYMQASVNGDRDPRFLRLLLQMLFQRQRYDEAEHVIHDLDTNPTPLTAGILHDEVPIFAIEGNFDRALRSANAAYNPDSDDYGDHLWYGQMLKLLIRRAQREGRLDQLPDIVRRAEDALHRACQIAPNAPDCRVLLVQILVAAKQMDKARVAASDAKDMIPPSASPLAMGYIHEALGDTKQAGQCYQRALELNPDLPLAVRLLADFYLRNLDVSRAAPLVERLLSGKLQTSESDLLSGRRMQAAILAGKGYSRLNEALALIDQNLKSPLASSRDLRVKVQLLLVDPLRARGPEVLELAEKLVLRGGAEPEPADRLQLARLYLVRGDWPHCREQMEKLVNGGQCEPRYVEAFARMLVDRNDLTDAGLWLDRLDRISRGSAGVALRAELLFRADSWGQVPDFLAAYIRAEKAEPADPLDRTLIVARLLEHLGGQLTAPGEQAAALSYFKAARQWYESYADKRRGNEMLLAGFDARRGNLEEALRGIARDGEKSAPLETAQVVAAIVTRPDAVPAQLQSLEATVLALLDKKHRPTPLLVGLAEIQVALGRLPAAEKLYREVLAAEPGNDMVRNNLSQVLAQQKTRLDEALDLIDKTIASAGPQGALLDTRAVVYIARREPQKALDDLQLALAEKATPLRLFHKAWAYQVLGEPAKCKEFLRAARAAGLEESLAAGPERDTYRQIAADQK